MATNGESATNWLKEHGETASLERLQKIHDSIAARLEEAPDDAQRDGLLEALDAMDSYIISREASVVSNGTVQPDLSPLHDNSTAAKPLLPAEEKKQRFKALLASGSLPPVIS